MDNKGYEEGYQSGDGGGPPNYNPGMNYPGDGGGDPNDTQQLPLQQDADDAPPSYPETLPQGYQNIGFCNLQQGFKPMGTFFLKYRFINV